MDGRDCLQAEIDSLRKRIAELTQQIEIKTDLLESKCVELAETKSEIQFLSGQVNAFQYIFNNRKDQA